MSQARNKRYIIITAPSYYKAAWSFHSLIRGCRNCIPPNIHTAASPPIIDCIPPNNLSMVFFCISSNNLTLVCISAQVCTWIRGKRVFHFWWRPFFWSSLNLFTWKKSWSRFIPPSVENKANYPPQCSTKICTTGLIIVITFSFKNTLFIIQFSTSLDRRMKNWRCITVIEKLINRGGVLEDVLGLEDTFWSPWPRCLKSLALASKP